LLKSIVGFLFSNDPQIGRFVNADPYDQFPSPYTGMGNDPVNNVDPSGGFSLSGITGSTNLLFNTAVATVAGGLIGGIVDFATGGNGKGTIIGAGITLGVGLSSGVSWGSAATRNTLSIASAVLSSANSLLQISKQVDFKPYLQSNNSRYDVASMQSDPPSRWERLLSSYKKLDRWVGEHGGDWINENINPLTPFVEFATGKGYERGGFKNDKPRVQSAVNAVLFIMPGGKIVGTGGKVLINGLGSTGRTAAVNLTEQ
jgi:hypothetical protein